MTKKIAHSPASKKTLQLPAHVLEAKEDLRKKNDEYINTIKKLTETYDLHLARALKKMWVSLEKAEKRKYRAQRLKDNAWVHYFVIYTNYYSNLPDYYCQNKAQRKKLFENISRRAKNLQSILQSYGFDHHLAYSHQREIFGFYKWPHPNKRLKVRENEVEAPKISELLDRLIHGIRRELDETPTQRDDDENKARLFVCGMGEYLINAYGTPLNAVIATATHAIHNVEYSESQIRKILAREGVGKGEYNF
jgi:hypothetical protein